MPRTIDGILASHRAAAERRAQGRPIWDRKIQLRDIFHNDELTFEQRRDAIVRRIESSGWPGRSETLAMLLEELADVVDAEEFDGVWDAIYDEADVDRVWISTV
jgi:hypothetical protein